MKKSLLSLVPVLALAAVIAVPSVGASSGLTIDAPKAGSTVEDSATFGGYASVAPGGEVSGNTTNGSECSGPTAVMFTDSSGAKAYAAVNDTSQGSLKLTGTRWSLPIDLSTDVFSQSGNTRKVALKPGRLTLTVSSQASGCEATVTYDYQPQDATATAAAETPTPTPTPSDSPELIVAVEPTNTIDPVWVFLAGALIGAALLSLSEVSAVSYLKKHGKGSKK